MIRGRPSSTILPNPACAFLIVLIVGRTSDTVFVMCGVTPWLINGVCSDTGGIPSTCFICAPSPSDGAKAARTVLGRRDRWFNLGR